MFVIRLLEPSDRSFVWEFITEHWGAPCVAAHGKVFHLEEHPGFLALDPAGRVMGLLTYCIAEAACEILSLDSLVEGRGVGTALLEGVRRAAAEEGCRRIWLVTTNDNLRALGFYQKRGFRLAALHCGAVDLARRVKPQIPLVSAEGIPIRDELELEAEVITS